jgi:hypothetical protein
MSGGKLQTARYKRSFVACGWNHVAIADEFLLEPIVICDCRWRLAIEAIGSDEAIANRKATIGNAKDVML